MVHVIKSKNNVFTEDLEDEFNLSNLSKFSNEDKEEDNNTIKEE